MEDAPGDSPRAGRPHLVFADDSATQRVLVSAVLSDAYQVSAAADGVEALKLIHAHPPDAILSDLDMPGLDGASLLRLVKGDPALRHIPFILITGEERKALRTLEAGADDFLQKPYGPEELRARVAAAVRTYRMYRELRAQHAEVVRIHSESKRLQLELTQSQKLEAVGRLAAGIAHEINTPIQFIGDNTCFMGDAFEALHQMLDLQAAALAGAPEEVRQGLARAAERLDLAYFLENVTSTVAQTLEGVQRVASIVRAMKEFAHPDQKEMVATDLNRALAATIEVARNEYKYVADVGTSLADLPLVCCHAGDLNQVFLNIIVNAAHAIADKVKGTEGRGYIQVATSVDGDAVVVAISDTGGGIPEDIRQKIFEPFFTTKEVGRGTGQGLAIARNIVEQHKGTLRFESLEGVGATFFVRLPVGAGASPVAEVAA
ncbi:MAG: response regulator [Anaeromyxobacter sp.]|nr:response regulator [Anaeromyxobacter sp.]MBL0276475.1 response regulator [Anaeromyxobacter sp.]